MFKLNDQAKFASEFIDKYLSRGFGSMNKNDVEVLLFTLFKRDGVLADKSNFELAKMLHITEARVKRLAYESEIVYGETEEKVLQKRFLDLLYKTKIQVENGTLRFVVEDKYLRSTIYETLKQNGYYIDSSFNSEIVSVKKEALVFLLDQYYSDTDKKEILDGYNAVRKEVKKADKKSFSEVMSVVLDKFLEKGVDVAVEGIGKVDFKSFLQYLAPGMKAVKTVVKIIATIASIIV